MQTVVNFCRAYPEVVIFFVLGLGYLIGRIKFAGFSLGATASILILALIVGQVHIQINPLLPNIAFALFLFAIGYKVGPYFFSSLNLSSLKYIFLSCFFCIVGLITVIFIGHFFHFNSGLTAGLFGGALTQSAVIGTASDAIRQLPILSSQRGILISDVTVAYALTYIFGMAGLIIFYRIFAFVFKNSISKHLTSLRTSLGIHHQSVQNTSLFAWSKEVELRAYQVEQKKLVGKSIKKIQKLLGKEVRIEQVKREGELLQGEILSLKIKPNDLLAIAGTDASLVDLENAIGPEIYDEPVLNITGEVLKICVLHKIIGKTIAAVQKKYGNACFFKRIIREGHELALLPNTRIEKCDIVEVVGSKKDVESFAKEIGYPQRPTSKTDIVTVAVGCLLGTLLGLVVVRVQMLPITLGIGGGVLISGLIFGWLRSLHPTFGRIPDGALWIFTDVGLNFFIVCVGLNAAPAALVALKTTGVDLFFAGVILTLVPTILSLLFGKYILRLNLVLLLGGLTGAGTCTPALNALQDSLGTGSLVLGYTVPYAFSNVLLTIFGSVIVHVMYIMG